MVTWIDVQGLGDETTLRRIGECFELHPLALEEIGNVPLNAPNSNRSSISI
ncbi:MAG: hypothetical protein R3A47_10400 [Polyangiales bacterium]